MADLDLQSLGMRLGEAITPTPRDAPQVRYGTIDAVNADGTLDVTIDGTTLRSMCATTGCVGAAAGMRCVVLRQGALATVVGLIAGHDLGNIVLPNAKSLYGTNSNSNPKYVFEPRNASDNCAINYSGYAESNSSTEIYGNAIGIFSKGRINLSGDITDGWYGTTAASIVTGGFVQYMTFGNIAVVRVQDVTFGTTAPATNNATICSGLPPADGSNFIFPMKTAQAETSSMRVKITSAGLMQTHYAAATTASTSRQWFGLAVYPYTR